MALENESNNEQSAVFHHSFTHPSEEQSTEPNAPFHVTTYFSSLRGGAGQVISPTAETGEMLVYSQNVERSDGETQTAVSRANAPFYLTLLIDNSGSMAPSLELAKQDVITFLNQLEAANQNHIQLSIMNFNEQIELQQRFEPTYSDTNLIAEIPQTDDPTCLYDALSSALQGLEQISPSLPDRAVLVLTDGRDLLLSGRDSIECSAAKLSQIQEQAKEDGIPIHILLYEGDNGRAKAKTLTLASMSFGLFYDRGEDQQLIKNAAQAAATMTAEPEPEPEESAEEEPETAAFTPTPTLLESKKAAEVNLQRFFREILQTIEQRWVVTSTIYTAGGLTTAVLTPNLPTHTFEPIPITFTAPRAYLPAPTVALQNCGTGQAAQERDQEQGDNAEQGSNTEQNNGAAEGTILAQNIQDDLETTGSATFTVKLTEPQQISQLTADLLIVSTVSQMEPPRLHATLNPIGNLGTMTEATFTLEDSLLLAELPEGMAYRLNIYAIDAQGKQLGAGMMGAVDSCLFRYTRPSSPSLAVGLINDEDALRQPFIDTVITWSGEESMLPPEELTVYIHQRRGLFRRPSELYKEDCTIAPNDSPGLYQPEDGCIFIPLPPEESANQPDPASPLEDSGVEAEQRPLIVQQYQLYVPFDREWREFEISVQADSGREFIPVLSGNRLETNWLSRLIDTIGNSLQEILIALLILVALILLYIFLVYRRIRRQDKAQPSPAKESQPTPPLRLTIVKSPDDHARHQTWSVKEALLSDSISSITIGRHGCDINIQNDWQISRAHLRLERQNDEYALTDLRSENGTFLWQGLQTQGEYAEKLQSEQRKVLYFDTYKPFFVRLGEQTVLKLGYVEAEINEVV